MPAFLPLLGLLFIGLKLGGIIAWSWWLVLLPLYGAVVVALVIFAIGALGVYALDKHDVRQRRLAREANSVRNLHARM